MKKQEIIDIGIVFVCITALFSVYVLGLIFYPLAVAFLIVTLLLLFTSRSIYECHKEELPWRKK